VANVDVATVYEKLLPDKVVKPNRFKKLTEVESSCSGFILLLGVDKTHPQLAHHNIFFSSDYPCEFEEIFQKGIPPTEPTVYVSITSKTDTDHAPDGSENWFVLVNVPPLGSNFDWTTQAEPYHDVVLNYLAERIGLDVREHIRVEKMLTPVDIARLTGARRGALYGASSNSRFNAFRRPHNRAPDVSRLYFVGGTTHPGGGVPMVMLSGKVAAGFILEDFR
jgi:phytoene desaturase